MTADDPLRPYLLAAVDGDERALEELIRRSQPAVWHLCAALGSQGEVEDLVQETYLRALRALPTYRGEAPVRIWLLVIARRTCADHVRRRRRRRRLDDRLRQHAVESIAQDITPVDDLLAALGPDRREAFVLTQLIGLGYEEAAAVAGCPVGTIRSRVARARADLLTFLGQARSG